MRNQKDLLMSVLRPFIFDPLVDWTLRCVVCWIVCLELLSSPIVICELMHISFKFVGHTVNLFSNPGACLSNLYVFCHTRDKSKKKEAADVEDGNKPGKEALARVQDRLDGCVSTDKKRKGGEKIFIAES